MKRHFLLFCLLSTPIIAHAMEDQPDTTLFPVSCRVPVIDLEYFDGGNNNPAYIHYELVSPEEAAKLLAFEEFINEQMTEDFKKWNLKKALQEQYNTRVLPHLKKRSNSNS